MAESDNLFLSENIKNQTELTSPTDTIYYCGYYSVTLKDSNTNMSLVNKTVNFNINSANYTNLTDSNGIASINLKLAPGTYNVEAFFTGDDLYDASDCFKSTVKILPTVSAKDITKYYKGSTQYSAVFYDICGNVLKNSQVSINVNGKTYNKKTNSKGVVNIAVNLKPGNYKIISTDPVTGYSLTTKFKILPTIVSNDFKKVAGDSRKYSAKLFKSNGKALTNKYVKIKVKGKIFKVKTNSKGKVYLSLNHLKAGTYKIICYNTDGFSKTNTVKIYKIATTKLTAYSYTFLSNDSKVITVKLTTSLNDNTKSGKTVKIKIGGKTYSKKTDSEGIINLNVNSVKKGFYTVKYTYVGNKFIKSSKATNLLTILDTNQSTLNIKGTTHFGYGAGTSLKVSLAAGGVPLYKRTVTLTLAGKTYTRTTDKNGIVSVKVPLDLKIGKYTLDVKANSKLRVNGTSKSFNIDVFQRSPSKITWKCGTSYKDSLQSFKLLLTNSAGKPISGEVIELTIDGKTYTGKTASNGYATIKTSVALGKYKVSVKFGGCNDYLPSSMSKSINVKLSKFGGGLNERNGISYLSAYLKATAHCPVNNAKIKALVKSLTSGLTNNIDKAKALFNYVRDNIVYDYYYNTHKGAVGTLNAKSANCVDQAHLLVSMYRTAGFKARYVHGTCVFDDGVFGHVWTQVLIGKTWVVGDPINSKNSLGKIKNWNTNTFKLKSRYLSPPF